MSTRDEEARYERAGRRVKELRALYLHATIFVVVNAGLHAIDFLTSPGVYWAFWPLLGWGVGLAAHAFVTFRWLPLFGPAWEERKIKELMEKRRGT